MNDSTFIYEGDDKRIILHSLKKYDYIVDTLEELIDGENNIVNVNQRATAVYESEKSERNIIEDHSIHQILKTTHHRNDDFMTNGFKNQFGNHSSTSLDSGEITSANSLFGNESIDPLDYDIEGNEIIVEENGAIVEVKITL